MVNRVSSYFPKGGNSTTQTELKNDMDTRKVKRHRKTGNREPQQNYRLGTVSEISFQDIVDKLSVVRFTGG